MEHRHRRRGGSKAESCTGRGFRQWIWGVSEEGTGASPSLWGWGGTRGGPQHFGGLSPSFPTPYRSLSQPRPPPEPGEPLTPKPAGDEEGDDPGELKSP